MAESADEKERKDTTAKIVDSCSRKKLIVAGPGTGKGHRYLPIPGRAYPDENQVHHS